MKKLAYAVGIIALLVFSGQLTYACSCADIPQAEIEGLSKPEFRRQYLSGKVVFTGRVVEEGTPYQTKHGQYRAYTFEVGKYWKGPVAKKVYVHTAVSGAACGVSYVIGQDYLVMALRSGSKLRVSLCTHHLANKHREVFLRKLRGNNSPKR